MHAGDNCGPGGGGIDCRRNRQEVGGGWKANEGAAKADGGAHGGWPNIGIILQALARVGDGPPTHLSVCFLPCGLGLVEIAIEDQWAQSADGAGVQGSASIYRQSKTADVEPLYPCGECGVLYQHISDWLAAY